MDKRFQNTSYSIRKKKLSLMGAKFHVLDSNGQVILFSKMKAFKLKEDIRLYSSEDMSDELITIKARNILDFSATYDVNDAKSGEKVGALKRKGMKSLLRDEWVIFDKNDKEVGLIKEDSMGLALLRRSLTNLIPQKYAIYWDNEVVGIFKQNFNPFTMKVKIDFSKDINKKVDGRLGMAAGILLCAVEGKQK